MPSYLRIRLQAVPSDLEDVVTQHCFDHGASGVSEALNFVQPDLTYDPRVLTGRTCEMDAYFSEKPGQDFFSRLNEWSPGIQCEIFEEEEKDWLELWKKDFKPFALVEPYWVVPSWCESPVEDSRALRIDPGMAFGTGTHATTQLAANFLMRRWSQNKEGQALSLLDVGTGTAILAMLAERIGYSPVVGLEIDPEARRVARENIAANQSTVDVRDELLEDYDHSHDVVVANIIDGVLIKLRKPLLGATRVGGDLFLTGILLERENIFADAFLKDDVQVVRRWQNDEWVGYWVRRLS